MSAQGNIVAALMARVDALSSSYTILYPRKGGEQPSTEHLRVAFLPNDDIPADLHSNVKRRRGFVYITHVARLGFYQVASENKAGAIADHFPRGLRLTYGGDTVKIVTATVRPAIETGGRWETPVRVEYEATA